MQHWCAEETFMPTPHCLLISLIHRPKLVCVIMTSTLSDVPAAKESEAHCCQSLASASDAGHAFIQVQSLSLSRARWAMR